MTLHGSNPAPNLDSASSAPEAGERVRLPSEACSMLARSLDRWARGTEDVQSTLAGLPRFDRYAAGHAVGLYVDDRRTPWLELDGELRFSLARLYSVTPRGVQLVGQIQVRAVLKKAEGDVESEAPVPGSEVVGGAKAEVQIHFYVHELSAPGTREVEDHDELSREIQSQHEILLDVAAPKDAFDPAFL